MGKNIYDIGLDFISDDSLLKKGYNFYPHDDDDEEEDKKPKKRRKSRRGLENEYKKALKRYHDEKIKTEDLKSEIEALAKQANKLADKYDISYKKMKILHEKMEEIRKKINKLDDDGAQYLSPEEEPEELELEEGVVTIETSEE